MSNFTAIRLRIPKDMQIDSTVYEEILPDMNLKAPVRLAKRNDERELTHTDMDGRCQNEGCAADISCAKSCRCRKDFCRKQSRASEMEVGDLQQCLCLHCSRFDTLEKLNEDRRSCRLNFSGGNKRQNRSQPEDAWVLSSETMLFFAGKGRQHPNNLRLTDSLSCEDLERTITDDNETSDLESNIMDDACSENVHKDGGRSIFSVQPLVLSQNVNLEDIGIIKSDRSQQLWLRCKKISYCPKSIAGTSGFMACASKDNGGKKRDLSRVGNRSICQVEGCMCDLSNAKDYFRRRKVCETHFKASEVNVQNILQRFCQQCSRFHVLAEFDKGRKSCKKMLLGHNMRRRKGQTETGASPRKKREEEVQSHRS